MKNFLVLITVLMTSACTTRPTPVVPTPPREARNFAIDAVHAVSPKADCVPLYQDVGEHHTHAAVCTLPNQQAVYCITNDASTLVCNPPGGGPPAPQQAQSTPPAPAPTPTPTPAPEPAPAPKKK